MTFNTNALQRLLAVIRKEGLPLKKLPVFGGKYTLEGWTKLDRTMFVITVGGKDVGIMDLIQVPGKYPVILAAWFAEDMRGRGYFTAMYKEVIKRTKALATIKDEVFLTIDGYETSEEEVFIGGEKKTMLVRRLPEEEAQAEHDKYAGGWRQKKTNADHPRADPAPAP